jgi:hypothetical protein
MKRLICITVALLCFTFFAMPAMAHHMAAGIVDEDIYEMIDTMVADTPHATMDLSRVTDGGMVTTILTIETDAAKFLEDMISEGLMDYIPMLDGELTVLIEYGGDNNRSSTMTIIQMEPVE